MFYNGFAKLIEVLIEMGWTCGQPNERAHKILNPEVKE